MFQNSGVMLRCGIHKCPQRCHQLYDHSMMECEAICRTTCSNGHVTRQKCRDTQIIDCRSCEDEKRAKERKQKHDLELIKKRDKDRCEHLKEIELLDEKIELERQHLDEIRLTRERKQAVEQRKKDLEDSKLRVLRESFVENRSKSPTPLAASWTPPLNAPKSQSTNDALRSDQSPSSKFKPVGRNQPQPASAEEYGTSTNSESPFPKYESAAAKEWKRQKDVENSSNGAIDSIMNMIGLEGVKEQVLQINSRVAISHRQGTDMKDERLGVALLGNPGTGIFLRS
jgi:hypothetical protein